MAKPSITLTEKDLGWDKLKDQVIKLSHPGAFCLVGVQGSQAAANYQGPGTKKLTIAEIATIHEFGTARIPERSFIRATIDQHRRAIQKRATLLGTGVLTLKFTARAALELLGMYAVGLIQQRIANRIAPPNRPSTIARKGSSVPLIHRGQLRGSITYTIEAS